MNQGMAFIVSPMPRAPAARSSSPRRGAPMPDGARIGFIGAGRVGLALSRAFAREGMPVVAVASRRRASAEALAAPLAACRVFDAPQAVVDSADLVFLCVPDDAIAPLAASLIWREGVSAVHCSGASELTALAAARAAGAQVGSFHPLLMFADPEVAAAALPGCAIALEAEGELLRELEAMAAALGAQTLRVPPGARAAYHAASHYGAAFICVLLDEGMKILDAAGMGGEAPRKALLSLARGTLDALEQTGPARAMAGVYARGDGGSAAGHLRALEAMNPDIVAFYRALALRSVALAEEAKRIDRASADSLRNLLSAKSAQTDQ
jgi:predicted short-subunit dehydrogenase-like oxidoreductase (DUF2520 family)